MEHTKNEWIEVAAFESHVSYPQASDTGKFLVTLDISAVSGEKEAEKQENGSSW